MTSWVSRGGVARRAAGGAAIAASLAAVITRGRTAEGAARRLVFVPHAMPDSLDPVATPTTPVRTAALAIYETLYGTDESLNPMPQMVLRHRVEDGGRDWVFQLRPGLMFHDGAAVTARDCVASLRRWMRRDVIGLTLADRLAAMEAVDDTTLSVRLKKPLPSLLHMLAKSQPSPPVIMPARLADSDPAKPVNEVIGSGPFRLEASSWQPGTSFGLVRFDKYLPRAEASSFTGGRRLAQLDRIFVRLSKDPMQELRDGTVDWVEWMPAGQPAGVKDEPGVIITRLDEFGYYAQLRLNHGWGPTANPGIRQAILAAIDQTAVMEAVFGAESRQYKTPAGLFTAGSIFASDAGTDRIGAKRPPHTIRAMLKDAGYKGEPLILLKPEDDPVHAHLTSAVAEELKQSGLKVQERRIDQRGLAHPRDKHPAPEGGAWSAFCESAPGPDHIDPITIQAAAGKSAAPAGWAAWPDDPKAVRLRDSWIDTADLRARRVIAGQLQEQLFTTAAFVPLGQWFPASGLRLTLSGQQKGPFPVFWELTNA